MPPLPAAANDLELATTEVTVATQSQRHRQAMTALLKERVSGGAWPTRLVRPGVHCGGAALVRAATVGTTVAYVMNRMHTGVTTDRRLTNLDTAITTSL